MKRRQNQQKEAICWRENCYFKINNTNGKGMGLSHRRCGFTLVEIMIVAAIIALLAAICVPSFLRARKRSQATRVLEDLRLLDHAIDQYAVETNKSSGMRPVFSDLKAYLKKNERLYNTGRDLFNRRYGPFVVDSPPTVPRRTFNTLSDVADATFWSPYY